MAPSKHRVLILGHQGQIGRELYAQAVLRDHSVQGWDLHTGQNLYRPDQIIEYERALRTHTVVMLAANCQDIVYANLAVALLRNRCEQCVLVTLGSASTYWTNLARRDLVDPDYINQKHYFDELIAWQQSEQIELARWNPWIMHVRPGIIDCALNQNRRPPKMSSQRLAEIIWSNIDLWTGVRELVVAYQPRATEEDPGAKSM